MLLEQLPKYNPSAVFIFNMDGNIVYKNDPSEKNFKEIKNISDLKIKNINKIIEESTKLKEYYDYNNLYYQLDIQGSKEHNSIFVYSTDITEIMDLNKKLTKTHQDLMEKSKAAQMGQLIGTIAHQVKQPISVIKMLIETIQLSEELGLETNTLETYPKVLEQADFLLDTVDLFRNFLNPNKIKEKTNLVDIINKTTTIISDITSGIYVEKKFDNINSKVYVNPNEIIQVCMNIIKNSKDILIEKDVDKKVLILNVYEENDYQVITIQDNANGVPKDIIDKIFEPYFTTKSEENGTGIGLDLSKQIIEEKNNGFLSVENREFNYDNEKYYGACFIIKLKIMTNQEEEEQI